MSIVMVVDDMAVVREPIAASLRAAGYTTICCQDGTSALTAAVAAQPDLILLDLAMPGMDGMQVLHGLRENPGTAHTSVILLTATAQKQQILEAAQLGVREYILKSSFSLPELILRVAKGIRATRAAIQAAGGATGSLALKPAGPSAPENPTDAFDTQAA